MKRQVMGHGERKAPANRSTGFYTIVFRDMYSHAECERLADALEWYRNGAEILVVRRYHGFRLYRNSATMTPTMTECNVYDWKKGTAHSAKSDEIAHVKRLIARYRTDKAFVDRISF